MQMHNHWVRCFFGLLLGSAAFPSLAADACVTQLPADLQSALAAAFPEYRLPRVTDNLEEDVRWSEQNNGRTCLTVAQGNFDGSGRKGWAVGLTQKQGNGGRVVVALPLPANAQWSLHTLAIWPGGRAGLYVEANAAGTYDSVNDAAPTEAGEVRQLVCPHDVVVYGKLESSGVAWCHQRGVWRHAWISD